MCKVDYTYTSDNYLRTGSNDPLCSSKRFAYSLVKPKVFIENFTDQGI